MLDTKDRTPYRFSFYESFAAGRGRGPLKARARQPANLEPRQSNFSTSIYSSPEDTVCSGVCTNGILAGELSPAPQSWWVTGRVFLVAVSKGFLLQHTMISPLPQSLCFLEF